MATFAQKFATKKQSEGNSIQEEIMLESAQQAQEDLAKQVSEATSGEQNVTEIFKNNSKENETGKRSGGAVQAIEQEIEDNNLQSFLKRIDKASSAEEVAAVMQEYEQLLEKWGDKIASLRNKKHLEEYLSIMAAMTMLQALAQQSEMALSLKNMSSVLQASVISQQSLIQSQLADILSRSQQMQNQSQLTSQLASSQASMMQQSLQASMQAMQQTMAMLSSQSIQASMMLSQQGAQAAQQASQQSNVAQQLQAVMSNLQAMQANQSNQAAQILSQQAGQQGAQNAAQHAMLSQQQSQQNAAQTAAALTGQLQAVDNQHQTAPISSEHVHTHGSAAVEAGGHPPGCPCCTGNIQSIEAVSNYAAKALNAIQAAQPEHNAHPPGCPCCSPDNVSISPITNMADKALNDVMSQSAHGAGCGCPSCNPSNVSIEAFFPDISSQIGVSL